jgi:hypothetical protein
MKTLYKKINRFIFFCMAFAFIALSACKKDNVASPPVITSIRNYAAAPNDTLVTSIVPGQWIVIHGQNLNNAVAILFDGVSASFNYVLFTNEMAVVQIPSSIPFNDVAADELNTVKYTTTGGTTTFNFSVKSLPATITGNSLSSKDIVGDSVHIYGANLYLIKSVTMAGDAISPFTTASNGSSIGFKLPAIAQPMPWHVVVTAASGTYTFDISIVPIISSISNANPSQGDSVYVYGVNLNGIQSLTFAGTSITSFKEAANGSSIGFVAPSLSQKAPVTVVSNYGTATTVFNVNTQISNDGVLANMEWGDYFGWQWWGGVSLTVSNAANSQGWITVRSDFDGVFGTNNSMFISYNTGIMKSGDGTSSDGTYNFPIGANQWVPTANLSDPVDNWAIQFEISVAKPWNGGSLCFVSGFAGNYMARFEPWQISASSTAAVFTKGWRTVTIPLSSFRASDPTLGDGKGASVTSLTNLLGGTGKTNLNVYLHNYSTAPTTTGVYAAFDNVRVVKIK